MSQTTSSEPAPGRDAGLTVLAAVALVATPLAGALYLTLPPSPDQWLLDYTGWRITQGAVPYRDFLDGNWPAAHWLHALSTALFGNTPHSWRAVDFLLMCACALPGSALCTRLWGRAAGRWFLLLYPCLYVVSGAWFAGQRDVVAANLLLVALYGYWRGLERHRPAWQVATGLVLAFCTLIKPTFACLGVLLAAHAMLAARLGVLPVREALQHVAVAAVAALLGLAVGFAVLASESTHFFEFWDNAVRSIAVRLVADPHSFGESLQRALGLALTSWHWIVGGALLALVVRLPSLRGVELAGHLMPLVLWLTGAISWVLQVHGLPYTLGPIYTATLLWLCSGLGLAHELVLRASGTRRALAAACLLIALLGTAKKWSGTFGPSVAWLAGDLATEAYYSRFVAGDGLSAADAVNLAEELRRIVPAGDTVLVWGRGNAVNFLAQRRQPTRFHHNVHFVRPYLPDDLKERWRAWFEADLLRDMPAACLVNQREIARGWMSPEPTAFLQAFLSEHYRVQRRIGESVLYLRAEPAT